MMEDETVNNVYESMINGKLFKFNTNRIHSDQKPFKCIMRDKLFTQHSNLKTHMRSVMKLINVKHVINNLVTVTI